MTNPRLSRATPRGAWNPSPAVVEPVPDPEAEETTATGGLRVPAPLASGPVRDPDTIEAFGPNGELLRMVKGDDGVFRTVSTNIPPPPIGYNTDHPLLQQLRSRTQVVEKSPPRAPAYNNAPLWYMKHNGEIVRLQGDPANRAYYEDKGYVVLRQEEVDTYLKDQTRMVPDGQGGFKREVVQPAVRKLILQQQRRRAELITTIRNIAARNPSVELSGDLSFTPTDELEVLLKQLQAHQSVNFTLLQARQREVPDRYREEDDVKDVELASGEDLYRRKALSRQQGYLSDNNRMDEE